MYIRRNKIPAMHPLNEQETAKTPDRRGAIISDATTKAKASQYKHRSLLKLPSETRLNISFGKVQLHWLLPFHGRIKLSNHVLATCDGTLVRSFTVLAHKIDKGAGNGLVVGITEMLLNALA